MKLITDSDAVKSYLEDAAHFPGGFSPGVYRPQSEAEIAEILRAHHASGRPVLAQGARSSLTGGATPFGEAVVSLENLNRIEKIEKTGEGKGRAVLQPFVRLADLQREAATRGLFYPPVPTYDLATIGGTVATCAAGSATFKYGTTRDWIERLRLVLADGEILDIRRGACRADPKGWIEAKTAAGKKIRFQMPSSYRTPAPLKKVSCGYFAAPGADLLDFLIGSEGTLGIVTQVEARLIGAPASVVSGLAFFEGEEKAFAFVGEGRQLARAAWEKKGFGPDFRAMEYLDPACLDLLKNSGAAAKLRVPLPARPAAAVYFELELAARLGGAEAMRQLEAFVEKKEKAGGLAPLFGLLERHGALAPDELVLAFPDDAEMLEALRRLREAVPETINELIGKRHRHAPRLTKMAADVVAPFEKIFEMTRAFRGAAAASGLPVAIFGHVSDGNLHPNILVSAEEQMKPAREALLEAAKKTIALGGAPMAEHGVGRNPLKQELLRLFYGEAGVREMARAKRALDPRGILAPGVIFSKALFDEISLSDAPAAPAAPKTGVTRDVGDEEGRLWRFSLKTLTEIQRFVNGFLCRFLAHNEGAEELMLRLKKIGKKTSGYMTDYIAVPYSPQRVRELKMLGFERDISESRLVFRHPEGIFPPFILKRLPGQAIDVKLLDEKIPVRYEFDQEDIWVPLEDVWKHIPAIEDRYREEAKKPFPFLSEAEIPDLEVGWRVGDLSRFGFTAGEIEGGPLYRRGVVPKISEKEPQLVLVERVIGVYGGFETEAKAPKLSPLSHFLYLKLKLFYVLFHKPLVFLVGMERVVGLLVFFLGPRWARRLLNEAHDAQWLRNNPKGKKDKENVEAILGRGGWEIFVDHRTLRRSLLPHLSLLDRTLKRIGLGPRRPMGQNEVSFRVLQRLEIEKHEEYTPSGVSDWKARVMRDRDLARRKLRSQIAYFLDEPLPGRRGNIATFAAFWGASTGWPALDYLLASLRFDWGPDPWTFHHIAIEGDFDSLVRAVQLPGEGQTFVTPDQKIENAAEIGFLDRFSFMWFLRQVFSKEVRAVPLKRAQALYLAGRLTREEYSRYAAGAENGCVKVEGPHLEIIDRRSGVPWFNQVRVTQAIETSFEMKNLPAAGGEKPVEPMESWRDRRRHLRGP